MMLRPLQGGIVSKFCCSATLLWFIVAVSIASIFTTTTTTAWQGISYGTRIIHTRTIPLPLQLRVVHCQNVHLHHIPKLLLGNTNDRFDDMRLWSSFEQHGHAHDGSTTNHTIISSPSSQVMNHPVRFLGKGTDAIVRLGAVLVAPNNEFHHFYRQSAIFIYAMGYDDDDDDSDATIQDTDGDVTRTYYIRGVILDHPTPFTLREMMSDSEKIRNNPLGSNWMFRGGDKGRENSVLLLHNQQHIVTSNSIISSSISSNSGEIGTSGIYQGGWDAALQMCQNTDDIDPAGNFKVFFNYCEFTEDEIEDLLLSNENNECWASVEVDSDIVLNENWDRGDCWRYLRNSISQHM
jgi:Uncharacterized ACR, COG1678